MKSMTGYGRGESSSENVTVKVEIKAVNHRFLEVNTRLPREYMAFEERVRRIIARRISRGHLDAFINLKRRGRMGIQVEVDKELAMAYYKALKELAQYLGFSPDFGLLDLVTRPEVLRLNEVEENPESMWPLLEVALEQALDELERMRLDEGSHLQQAMTEQWRHLKGLVDRFMGLEPQALEKYRLRLQSRAKELLAEGQVDEGRLALEVALFAERSAIDEEVTRLIGHLDTMNKLFDEEGAVGRKLDFLLQEVLREVNTIGSKAADMAISQGVLEAKAEIEKLREQGQNIE